MPQTFSVLLRSVVTASALAFALPAAAVDLNTADVETLAEELDGVGEVRAQAIIEYRQEHGEFESVGEFTEVSGIGAATLNKNRDDLAVEVAEE